VAIGWPPDPMAGPPCPVAWPPCPVFGERKRVLRRARLGTLAGMKPNKLRALLKEGKPTLGTHIHTTWPSIIEAIGASGAFDYVEFVAEYAPYTLHDLDNMARAAELYDLSLMLKLDQDSQQVVTQHAIGSGFHSILFVDVRTADDVRKCVRAVRPETPEDGGVHGVATRRITYMGYGGGQAYVQALRDVVIAVMIEKKSAVENLDEILSVPGIDMIQWGPSDYSMSVGHPGERGHPDVRAAEKKVFETCIQRGIPPRAEIGSPDDAKRFLDMGVRHFSIGTDIFVLYQWARQSGEAMRKLLENV
jgi:4-hydroxy-2-oxoheptanedioate aldolase